VLKALFKAGCTFEGTRLHSEADQPRSAVAYSTGHMTGAVGGRPPESNEQGGRR